MTKRQKIIAASLILSAGFLAIQFTQEGSFRYQAIAGLSLLALLLSIISLREGLDIKRRPATLLTLVLPPLFTAGVGLFYFLLPASLLARLPVIIPFAVGIYALLLTANIYSVAAVRTIQLARAAQAVGFILTLVTAFLLFDTVWSFRFPAYFNAPLVGLITFPLMLHALWSVQLEENISVSVWQISLVSSLCLAELALVLSFWPLSVVVASLSLTTAIYAILGLSQAKLTGRLFAKIVKEHLFFAGLFLLVVLATTSWKG